jgi:Domain of unknown function (DUF4249)
MKYVIILCLIVAAASACKEKYEAPIPSRKTGFLVIEGVVNTGNDTVNIPTQIRLSRTTPLDNRSLSPEIRAKVYVEDEASLKIQLLESTAGVYEANNMHLNETKKYRLHIITSDNKEYASDFVDVVQNPRIDSVTHKQGRTGLDLFVNANNPQNNTRFYQWNYVETWEFHSRYQTSLKYVITQGRSGDNYTVGYRDSVSFSYDPRLFICYKSSASSQIILGSTEKLANDVVYQPLLTIPQDDEKLSVKYSLLLFQYGWSKAGYQFLDKMRKNTETTGSIFDAQPSELLGNFHGVTDKSETVIGFFNVCPVRSTRIFLNNFDFPNWQYRTDCVQYEIENNSDSIKQKGIGLFPTTPATYTPRGAILTFYAADQNCVDCTLRGTNIKPSFWP